MNYRLSKKILQDIKKSANIWINCHKNPDPDSIGSALSLKHVLEKMGKKVRIICPTDITLDLSFLGGFKDIETKVDFEKLENNFDLFVILDSSSWYFATGSEHRRDKVKTIVIDHHYTNEYFADINLVDKNISSVGELLYRLFQDWRINIDNEIATCLLLAIMGDTGVFRFSNVTHETLRISADLLEKGADKDKIVYEIYNSTEIEQFKFWGEIFRSLRIDKKYNFVWVAVPNHIIAKYSNHIDYKESFATNFLQSVKGTDFGVIMTEKEKNKLFVSFRSRGDIDVSKMVTGELDGGGHKKAAGGGIEGLPFKEAVKKVLSICRKYAQEYKKKIKKVN